jgi:hypothetical protein
MWDVSSLYGLTGMEFEMERNRILSEYILSLPEEKRKVAYAKQLEIESVRISADDEEFNKWLMSQISENLGNISDQFVAMKHLIDGAPRNLSP